jgi:hypothetical protein
MNKHSRAFDVLPYLLALVIAGLLRFHRFLQLTNRFLNLYTRCLKVTLNLERELLQVLRSLLLILDFTAQIFNSPEQLVVYFHVLLEDTAFFLFLSCHFIILLLQLIYFNLFMAISLGCIPLHLASIRLHSRNLI